MSVLCAMHRVVLEQVPQRTSSCTGEVDDEAEGSDAAENAERSL